jgi:CheY-like chemotaxis protein
MRVLLVEDDADFALTVERAVHPIPDCELVWRASRDSALAALRTESFELVILDRRIPSADSVLDDHIEHGWRVFQFVREELTGTPVWFLTGSEDVDFATELNNDYAKTGDIHGRRQPEQMYQVFWKRRIADCIRRLKEFAEHRAALERIPIRMPAGTSALSPEENRTLQIFGRRRNGALVDSTLLGGGLSSSRVLKVVVKGANDAPIITAVAKVAPLPMIREEAERFRTDISRLAPGGFPPLTEQIEVGTGKVGGLFYGMVGADVESLFHRLATGHAGVAQVPTSLRDIERPWYQGKQVGVVRVGQIRRRFMGDAELPGINATLDGIDITAVEACEVEAAQCCQHGDLHCTNVVFDHTGRVMLIDFGDAGPSLASVDPVVLELSTVFHSQRTVLPRGWPTEAGIAQWITADAFAQGCTFAPFIMACREWANGEAASPEEVIAVSYGYAMRQLKYDDTDKALARGLIRACIARLVGTV